MKKPFISGLCQFLLLLVSLLSFSTTALAELKTFDASALLTESNLGIIDKSYVATRPIGDDNLEAIINDESAWIPNDTIILNDYTVENIWVRLNFTNTSDQTIKFLIIQDNAQILALEFLQYKNGELTTLQELGAAKPFHERKINHRYYIEPVVIAPNERFDIFIHSTSAGNDLVSRTKLWEYNTFFTNPELQSVWDIFYFGIISVMIIYNLIIYLLTRETPYLLYSVFVLGAMVLFLGLTGFGFQFVWPNQHWLNTKIAYIGMGLMLSFAGWFSISFLELKKSQPRLSNAVNILSWVSALCAFLILVLPFDENYTIVRFMSVVSMPIYILCWVGGLRSIGKSLNRTAVIYVCAWSILIFASLITLVNETLLNIIPFPTYIFVQISHAFEVVMLSMALATRIRLLKDKESVAQARAEEQTKFLARMSHEIRTPMNGIVGMSDLLSKRLTDETDKHYIEIINTSADALGRIINDILDYSKIEAGKMELTQDPFSIKGLVREVIDIFELQCDEKGLEISGIIESDVPDYVLGDNFRIRQILMNLVSNAVKYTHKGKIKIKVSCPDNTTWFEVTDTGEGISKPDQERLFDPFEQAATHNLRKESSTGLGLAICRELVNLMDGEINVHSLIGEGSTFWFKIELPAYDENLEEEHEENTDIALPIMNILVAEDNHVNQVVIKSILQSIGMNQVIVKNGIEAVGYFKDAHDDIDIIFMDCEMPAMDGFQATRVIREYEENNNLKRTPILALTAHTWHQELQNCYDSGMDELLLKPISRSSVENMLKKYTRTIKSPRTLRTEDMAQL